MRAALLALVSYTAAGSVTEDDVSSECTGSAFQNVTYQPVCKGMDIEHTLPQDYLRGKHLILANSHYPPFAEKTVDSYGNVTWSGWDFDVLPYIAEMLNFTYEVVDVADVSCANSSLYGDKWLEYVVSHSDMMLQWWAPTSQLLRFGTVTKGYSDSSPTLVSYQPSTTTKESFFERLERAPDSFLDPLSYEVWAVILLIIVVSAMVDFNLERTDPEARLAASLYEACSGALWGGFDAPKTRISALYQVMLSFVILVFVASYTANTAAFLTVRTVQSETAQNLDDLIAQGRFACVYPGDPFLNYYNAEYPGIRLHESESIQATLSDVQRGTCDVVIAPQFRVWMWYSDPSLCAFKQRDTLKRAEAGWATSNTNYCVRAAVSWAMARYALMKSA